MKKSPFLRFGFILLGLLALGAVSVFMGRGNDKSNPSISSYEPSGLRAFADLLRKQGYRVRADLATEPKLAQNEVPVLVSLDGYADSAGQDFLTHMDARREEFPAMIEVSVPTYFRAASLNAQNQSNEVQRVDGKQKLMVSDTTMDYYSNDNTSALVFKDTRNVGVITVTTSRGRGIRVAGGLNATNRFIDKHDNAAYLMYAVRLAAKPGATLVFCEAAFGGGKSLGLVGSMGLWAVGAWWQIGLLAVIVVFTLGKPFGLPKPRRFQQTGGREFVEGISMLFRRARAGGPALSSMLRQANEDIYRRMKLPRDAGPGERDRVIPENLSLLLRQVEAASLHRLANADAIRLARELDDAMRRFREEHRN